MGIELQGLSNEQLCDLMCNNYIPVTSCRLCGRKLKTESAIQLGFGPICYEKFNQKRTHKKLF